MWATLAVSFRAISPVESQFKMAVEKRKTPGKAMVCVSNTLLDELTESQIGQL